MGPREATQGELQGENVSSMKWRVPRPTGKPKRTWREVVQKDCQVHKLNRGMQCMVVDGGSRGVSG